jgi:hypothetical protein
MADGGIGESALLSAALEGAGTGAAVGGGLSLLTGRDPFQGALMGGLTGGLGGAFSDIPIGMDAFTAQTSTGLPTVAADAANSTQALTGLQPPPTGYTPTGYEDFGPISPYAGASTNGIVGAQGGQNVLQNQLGASVGGAPAINPDIMATGQGAAGSSLLSSPTVPATGMGAAPATGDGGLSSLLPQSTMGKAALGGGLGLAYLMNQEKSKYGVPATEKYSGPLSKFSYDPLTYKPDVVMPPTPLYRAQYADGGMIGQNPVERMSNANAIGANTGFPQAYMPTNQFAIPTQTPVGQNVLMGQGDVRVDPYTGQQNPDAMSGVMGDVRMASGGISSLGSYSDGGRMLKGPGDGMSDSIPAKIGGKQEARLADGEFVVPADVVSHLGNGSTDAGAKQLYSMMDKVRQARTGHKVQGRQIKPNKYMPA